MSNFSVTVLPSKVQFQVEDGEAVLAAALRQGYILPYGCKNGACGTCKGKLLEGSVDYGVYQKKALPDAERAQGKALFCQAKPLTDLVVEARTVGAAKGIQIKTLPCRIQKMERLADDVIVLHLKLPANERLRSSPGSSSSSCSRTARAAAFPWAMRRTTASSCSFTCGIFPAASSPTTSSAR